MLFVATLAFCAVGTPVKFGFNMGAFKAILLIRLVDKLALLPKEAAISLRVSKVAGAAPIKSVIALLTKSVVSFSCIQSCPPQQEQG